jgi:hypothetical protein
MEKEFITSIGKMIARDLTKLEEEISLYSSEEKIWRIHAEIKNSGGNLCLHLCGTLQHYIGRNLGKTDYVRNREHEFAAKGIPRVELIDEIRRTKLAVQSTLEKINPSILNQPYPEKVFDYTMTTLHFLIHLSAHLGYLLGQANYHRRLMS